MIRPSSRPRASGLAVGEEGEPDGPGSAQVVAPTPASASQTPIGPGDAPAMASDDSVGGEGGGPREDGPPHQHREESAVGRVVDGRPTRQAGEAAAVAGEGQGVEAPGPPGERDALLER